MYQLLILMTIGSIVWLIMGGINQYVKKHSLRYAKLKKINEQFRPQINTFNDYYSNEYQFDSKARFDNKNNHERMLDDYLQENKQTFEHINTLKNRNHFVNLNYNKAIENIYQIEPIAHFKGREEAVLKQNRLKIPSEYMVSYTVSYMSPKGRNRYEQTYTLHSMGIMERLHRIKENHIEKTEYQIFKETERAKMTAGLRYDILKRDNFKCVICGADANTHGVILHVDHIKPVAKGGLTVEENLQTLCRDCNLGKGAKY